jgi:hypothetical protein
VKALAIIALACGTAAADPLFEMDREPIAPAKQAASAVKLFDDGTWTVQDTAADGKPGPVSRGRLDKTAVDRIRHDLEAATWHTTTRTIRCFAKSLTHTIYSSHGTKLFTEEVCSGIVLDDASAKSLADIRGILDKATRP